MPAGKGNGRGGNIQPKFFDEKHIKQRERDRKYNTPLRNRYNYLRRATGSTREELEPYPTLEDKINYLTKKHFNLE